MKRSRGDDALTESQEDYLKQILLLAEDGGNVSTQSLSERLGVRPASVTGMVQKLARLGLVDHRRYRGVRLTHSGRQVALELLRHHRLLETYLVEHLDYNWGEVHEEAERLEHVISERFEARIAEVLGHPTHDPHGDPIPDADLRMPELGQETNLSSLAPRMGGTVSRVCVQDPDRLSVLEELGLVPGARVDVLGGESKNIRVAVAGKGRYLVPAELATQVWLKEPSQ